MTKPLLQPLKGFRDFLPQQKRIRDYVLERMLEVFRLYGFAPLETPTLEYASLLLGKYGTEADKLVYSFTDRGGREVALKYDQTVPTARVLAQYQHELPKFFRRYQVQPVFRADKPQKGRYREFTQCDIDIFNTTSSVADAEILACTYQAFSAVGLDSVQLKLNDRAVLLSTLQPFATESVDVFSIIQSIDKLDKVSQEDVVAELTSKGLDQSQAQQALEQIRQAKTSQQLKTIISHAKALGVPESAIAFTPTLARGLDYYTGMIIEMTLPSYRGGSLGGGGRYDNLIKQLGSVDIPAVGVAFGFDRIIEAVTQQQAVDTDLTQTTVLVTQFSDQLIPPALQAAAKLRQAGISTQVYPQADSLGKQMGYANKLKIPYVLVVGEEEAKQNKVTLKNMESGEQQLVSVEEVDQEIEKVKKLQR